VKKGTSGRRETWGGGLKCLHQRGGKCRLIETNSEPRQMSTSKGKDNQKTVVQDTPREGNGKSKQENKKKKKRDWD